MIRTLRITSIVAAVGAVVLLVLPVAYGVRRNPQIEEFLKAPSAIDEFTATKGQRPAEDKSQTSPLVKQAMDFARYLNPPPPPKPERAATTAPVQTQPEPLGPVSAKFELVGTSYYASHPELSLCLIDEPGKGLNWVRQGDTVGRLTIEQISDGTITVHDGQRTFDMVVKVNEPWRDLLRNPLGEARVGASPHTSAPAVPDVLDPRADISSRRRVGDRIIRSRPRPPDLAPRERITTASEPKVAVEEPVGGEGMTERDMVLERLIEDMKASRITPDEVARMGQLAQTLEQLEELQRQKAAGQFDANSVESDTPPPPPEE